MRSFVKIKFSQYGEITLSFTDIGKSFPSCEFLTSQISLLMLYARIKFSFNLAQNLCLVPILSLVNPEDRFLATMTIYDNKQNPS